MRGQRAGREHQGERGLAPKGCGVHACSVAGRRNSAAQGSSKAGATTRSEFRAVIVLSRPGHIEGGTAGETFDISLYDGGATPGSQEFTTTATYGADGWNGASGLAWTVPAGSYWIEFEVNWEDTLGTTSTATGALLDTGVANPVQTATTSDFGFTYDASAQSIGLQVSTVPEPASMVQLAGGALLLATLALARRRRG